MRKIANKDDDERRRRRNQWIVGIVLVVVMLFSVLGYGFQTQDSSSTNAQNGGAGGLVYGDYEFFPQGSGLFLLTLGNLQFLFTNLPANVPAIETNVPVLSTYSNQPLYVYTNDTLAGAELMRNLDSIVLRQQYACPVLANTTRDYSFFCQEDWPLKDCSVRMIILTEGEAPAITQQDSCIIIEAPQSQLVATVDAFLYKSMGVGFL